MAFDKPMFAEEMLRYEPIYCRECKQRVGEYFPAFGGARPQAAMCVTHGGPERWPNDWPRDRKGDPLPPWLLYARALKKSRKAPKKNLW